MTTTSLSEKAISLYRGEALAPMVRASTTPLRTLALEYGADFVYTEELVDRSLSDTIRVENQDLQTIDYIKDTSKLSKKVQRRLAREDNRPALLLRIDRQVEAGKLVCQIGSGEPELALAAALHVRRDVDAFDINMGCPRKFSVSGGMGSALLTDPDRACRIVRTLRDQLPDHPVSCKIRLLGNPQSTVDFITALVERGGAHAVAIHARRPGDDCVQPAKWTDLEQVVPLVRAKFPTLPLLINGDYYTRKEFTEFQQKHGTSGVLLGRPALYNMSIFRKPPPDTPVDHLGYDSPFLLDKTLVVQDYLRHSVRYKPHYKNVKYVVSEMMTNRRTPTWRVPNMPQQFPQQQTIGKTCNCGSLEELCQLWNVRFSPLSADTTSAHYPAGDHKYHDSYSLQGEVGANPADSSAMAGTKKSHPVPSDEKEDELPNKRTKTQNIAVKG